MDGNQREALLRLWQSTWFSKFQKNTDPLVKGSRYSDAYRSLVYQLHYAVTSDGLPYTCWEHLVEEFILQYSATVDDQTGLNNFSEGALSLAAHRKNESAIWKSSLSDMSLENLMTFQSSVESLKKNPEDTQFQQLIHMLNKNKKDAVAGIPDFLGHYEKVPLSTGSVCFENEYKTPLANSSTTPVNFSSSTCAINKFSPIQPQEPKQSNSCSVFQKSISFNAGFPNNSHDFNVGVQKRKQPSSADLSDHSTSLTFKTAREQFAIEQHKKTSRHSSLENGQSRKCLGSRRGLNSKFISPILSKQDEERQSNLENEIVDERLKNIDPKMVELMMNEIMDHGPPVTWDDIAGLEFAKSTIKEIVVWPLLRPDIFKGLRGPPKGILLFGPPGTGKTMIGKCIASQSKSTFFSISASSLTSKWIGDGEKLVRALFAVARCHQPAVVFIDEIDSLLSQRSESEHESSRRLKTEFLVQLDGATTCSDERLLIVGATNRPQELDEAARRRLVKRLYIPLPEVPARKKIVQKLLGNDGQMLQEEELEIICHQTEGYSGADMTNLCKEASLGPIRSMQFEEIEYISSEQVRPIVLQDFLDALKQVRASVSEKDLELYLDWNNKYGSIGTKC